MKEVIIGGEHAYLQSYYTVQMFYFILLFLNSVFLSFIFFFFSFFLSFFFFSFFLSFFLSFFDFIYRKPISNYAMSTRKARESELDKRNEDRWMRLTVHIYE